MLTLYINTCLNNVDICLFKDASIFKHELIQNVKNGSEVIMPTISKVIGNSNLNDIIVVNGPGSFTGVRLGVTIAKTFAYTLNLPIYTINSLQVARVSIEDDTIPVIHQNTDYYVESDNKELMCLNSDQFNDYSTHCKCIINPKTNYEKVYSFVKENIKSINPHSVKPEYVKKISVEK